MCKWSPTSATHFRMMIRFHDQLQPDPSENSPILSIVSKTTFFFRLKWFYSQGVVALGYPQEKSSQMVMKTSSRHQAKPIIFKIFQSRSSPWR